MTKSTRADSMTIRGRRFEWGLRTYVAAIINATPDSFSGDGVGGDQTRVAQLTNAATEAGADVIDVGAESTRPGARPVPVEEELARLIPAVRTVRAETDLPISVDTYKARVAEAALEVGADFVNDVWGLRRDPELAGVVAQAGCPVVVTHNRRARPRIGSIGGHYPNSEYDDIVRDLIGDLTGQIDFAMTAGIDMDRIIIDPGIGFGKSPPQNLELISRLAELGELGFPMMIGLSRKSFIGFALNDGNADRTSGTAAATALAILAGVDIIRVHDVRAMVGAARVADAVARANSPRPLET